MPLILFRPPKLNHFDTVRYEIDMLRFTANRLAEQKLTERDAWVYLEDFLLHYRNLIDFLGSQKPGANSTDLHITNIWQLANLVPPVELEEIYTRGRALRAKYEPSKDQGGVRISQYLQHCTTKRIEAKNWEVSTMVGDIEPLLSQIENHLGARTFILAPVPVKNLDYFSASTTVGTFTTAAVLIEPTLNKEPEDFE